MGQSNGFVFQEEHAGRYCMGWLRNQAKSGKIGTGGDVAILKGKKRCPSSY